MVLMNTSPSTTSIDVIRSVDPEVNASNVDPVEYGRHIETVHRVDKDSGIEVDHEEIGLEFNNNDEGIEAVETNSEWNFYHRSQMPVSALTELPIEEQLSEDTPEMIKSNPRYYGLTRRKIWIFLVLTILIVVGAVIGGVVAGLDKRLSKSVSSSNLAVVNWITTDNVTTYIVVMQDSDQSLIAYAGHTNAWTKVNISQCFEDSGGLAIRASTPLAAVATSDLTNPTDVKANQLSIFFLTPGNVLTQIVTNNASLGDWDWGDIGPHSDVNLTTAAGSQLASAWARCSNYTECGSGGISLTFEDTNQNYVVANSTYNWTAAIASDRLAANSSQALISMNGSNASQILNTDYLWGFFDTNGIIGTAWQDYQSGSWWWTDLGRNVLYGVPPSTMQQLAAASFRDRMHAFMVALFPNGSVTGRHWDPAPFNWLPEAKLDLLIGSGGIDNSSSNRLQPVGFSTIAMTADARLYGIAKTVGSVHEFQMDEADPYTFRWLGEVS
ncbi:hypothetical protein F5Y19DRAFT_14494 [Xylariaceae sp. FL1651]|nr:hypothetical protein F5Y19DRAFT_14494 [Xylariaceae sp. FL1651]